MNIKHLLPGTLALIAATAIAQTPAAKPSAPPKKPAAHPQQVSEGQRVFEQNCSRCHTPPDGFSPRITGTILKHMRVRASLSEHDEKELLHFFNP